MKTIIFAALALLLPSWAVPQSAYEYLSPVSLWGIDPLVATEIRLAVLSSLPARIECRFRGTRGEDVGIFTAAIEGRESDVIRPDLCRRRDGAPDPEGCRSRGGSVLVLSDQPLSAVAVIYVNGAVVAVVKLDRVEDEISSNRQSRFHGSLKSSEATQGQHSRLEIP